ncbi:MAG: hypothetical protein DLM69_01245, partial [Candidatus Chloroheliales bacterium]
EAAATWVGSPMHQAYASVAPKPEGWTTLADKLGEMLRQDYDWAEDVAAIKLPTLIVVGDGDGVRPEHAVEMFRLLGGGPPDTEEMLRQFGGVSRPPKSQLAMLPGTTHFNILTRTDLLLPSVTQFLDAPMPEAM